MLHQGTKLVPADLIGFAKPVDDLLPGCRPSTTC
ncbi:hypothetical protein NKH77_13330 [Streptomyces sp. M19]